MADTAPYSWKNNLCRRSIITRIFEGNIVKMNSTSIEPNTMTVVPCFCGLRLALPITPDLISFPRPGSKDN
jgi:hypothetical protein